MFFSPCKLGKYRIDWLVVGNHLTGTIPPELAVLTSLIGISVARNGLTGTIPPALFGLSTLSTLVLVRTDHDLQPAAVDFTACSTTSHAI